MLEVELKFRLADSTEIIRRLIELDARPAATQSQADLYLSHPCRDFHATDEALRIRTCGDDSVLTYKGPASRTGVKSRQEIEIPLGGDRDRFLEVFHNLGFRSFLTVRKTRQPFELTWQGREFHIAMDDVPSVGRFLEIELLATPDELAAAEAAVRGLAQALGLDAVEEKTYLELVWEAQKSSKCSLEESGPKR